MANIIEIDVRTPFLRPNFKYIVECMKKDETIVLVNGREDAFSLGRNIRRKGFSSSVTRVSETTWRVVLQDGNKLIKHGMQDDPAYISEDHLKKIAQIEKGQKIKVVNRGQAVYFNGIYKKMKPNDSRKLKFSKEEDGYAMWIVKEVKAKKLS